MTAARRDSSPAGAPANVSKLIDAFAGLRIVVVGDAILDAYLEGTARRLSREAPVPVVTVDHRTEAAGGAANVAMNLARLGARVRLVSAVGRDDAGDRLCRLLERHRVDTGGVVSAPDRATVAKRRVLAGGQILVRFDEGSMAALDSSQEAKLAAELRDAAVRADAVVVADYRCGVMTDGVVAALTATERRGTTLVLDVKQPRRYRDAQPLAWTPSYEEAAAVVGERDDLQGPERARAAVAVGGGLLDVSGAQIVAVTLDRDGALVLERGRSPHRVYGRAVPHRCSAGAGDTFTAAFALGLAARGDAATVAEVAAAAAAVVVAKPGTSTCSRAELRLRLRPGGKVVRDADTLAVEAERHRREGRRIVFTNGCFDILHRGHLALLNAAKELGDVLVVAVNGDASVRRLKGSGRPINSLADRTELLAGLSCVDHVVGFDDDRPDEILRSLRPEVVVKGGDYTPQTLPEAPLIAELGAELHIVDPVPERSTTRIVERLRAVPS